MGNRAKLPMVETNQEVPVTGIPVFRQLEVMEFMEATEAIVEVTGDVEVVTGDVEVVTAAAEEVMVAAAIKSSQQSINAQQERILQD